MYVRMHRRLIGDNTDWLGILRPLLRVMDCSVVIPTSNGSTSSGSASNGCTGNRSHLAYLYIVHIYVHADDVCVCGYILRAFVCVCACVCVYMCVCACECV